MAHLKLIDGGKTARGGNAAAVPDFRLTYHGTIATLDVLTAAARQWLAENIDIEPWQWLGKRRIGIDPSIAQEVREALTEAGFIDEDEDGSR